MRSWCSLFFPCPSYSVLFSTIVMLGLLKYAIAVSPLLLQAGANPMPASNLHMRQNSDMTGAVASESDICSNIGVELLQQGGNAADAVSQNKRSLRLY